MPGPGRAPHPPPWCLRPDNVSRVGGGYDSDIVMLFTTRLETAEKAVEELKRDREHLLTKLQHKETLVIAARKEAERQRRQNEGAEADTKEKVAAWLRCVLVGVPLHASPLTCHALTRACARAPSARAPAVSARAACASSSTRRS